MQYVTDMVVVGESPQNTGSEPSSSWTGFEAAHGRSLPVDVPWAPLCPVRDPLLPLSAAFTQVDSLSPWDVSPRNMARNIDIVPPSPSGGVQRPVLPRDSWPDQNGIANSMLFDVEGDLVSWLAAWSGSTPCVPLGIPTFILPDTPMLHVMPGMTNAPCPNPLENMFLVNWQRNTLQQNTDCTTTNIAPGCTPRPVDIPEELTLALWGGRTANGAIPGSVACFGVSLSGPPGTVTADKAGTIARFPSHLL